MRVYDGSSVLTYLSLAVDSNDVPHTVFNAGLAYYSNRVGGSWDSTPIALIIGKTMRGMDIVINEDDYAEVAYINQTDNYLTAEVADTNDPTVAGDFTEQETGDHQAQSRLDRSRKVRRCLRRHGLGLEPRASAAVAAHAAVLEPCVA